MCLELAAIRSYLFKLLQAGNKHGSRGKIKHWNQPGVFASCSPALPFKRRPSRACFNSVKPSMQRWTYKITMQNRIPASSCLRFCRSLSNSSAHQTQYETSADSNNCNLCLGCLPCRLKLHLTRGHTAKSASSWCTLLEVPRVGLSMKYNTVTKGH